MTRKRYEIAFDTVEDADYIAFIEDLRADGKSVMAIMRQALEALAEGPQQPAPAPSQLPQGDMLEAVGVLKRIANALERAPTSTPARMMAPPPPVFEDDDPVAMTIKADTSIDAGVNFLASLANLQM